MKQPKKCILIDGPSYAYRAFYAIQSLMNSKGQPTNAVYGFVRMLSKIVKEEKPDYIAVCFDLPKPTFRHIEYEEYKAHRKPTPDDLVVQIPVIKEVIDAYGIPLIEQEGYEADDIIATLARRAAAQDIESIIFTSDKDMMQIVDANVKIMVGGKEPVLYDRDKVNEKYGVYPEQIIDLLSMTGDVSDNISGVPGIGIKTAGRLINEYGSIDKMYSQIDTMKNVKIRAKLVEHKETVMTNRNLVRLIDNVGLTIDIPQCQYAGPNKEKLVSLFKECEFTGLVNDMLEHTVVKDASYECVSDKKSFESFCEKIKEVTGFVVDTETTHIDPMQAELVGASFCWDEHTAYYVSLGSGISLSDFKDKLTAVLEDDTVKKYGHNIKYDKIVLLNSGIDLKGVSFDTIIAHYLINPSKTRHSLSEIALEYLNYKMTSLRELIGTGKNKISIREVALEDMTNYACEDALIIYKLKNIFDDILHKKDLFTLFKDMEIPLIDVLTVMEYQGIAIDQEFLSDMAKHVDGTLDTLTQRIYTLAGEEFNINSPKSLAVILFDKLNLPSKKKTKTGYSTNVDVLMALAQYHELPQEILSYRQLAKLKSTYIDVLPTLVNAKTGRIHTSFNQTVTATGRLSSSDPNLQNIPVKTDMGREIRRAFVPRADRGQWYLVGADYSQIELRILAHLSQDPVLINAFRNNVDIHSYTAGLIYGADPEAVTPDMRRRAKIVNFGIIYGMSSYGLAKDLGMKEGEAKEFINQYFQRYVGVDNYIKDTIKKARKDKYVKTLFNRKRYIPEITSANFTIRTFSERTAVNTPIQGTASDIIKLAMIELSKIIMKEKLESRMLLQIHDELVFEVPEKECEEFMHTVTHVMEEVVHLDVPITVDIASGKNWAQI
ncbi:MAG: DNA polymerase I [Candidatus Ancaeobacter aquaticus]|nr:DNA polymerase I [Candidatus Ancaeobacter aquaticus]